MLLRGFDVMVLKGILTDVMYDVELLKEEGGDFLGLAIVLNEDKLYFIFRSDNDYFDSDIMPWYLYLNKSYEYKQGYIEDYAVYEIYKILNKHDPMDLKIIIDKDLSVFKIFKDRKMIFDYTIG